MFIPIYIFILVVISAFGLGFACGILINLKKVSKKETNEKIKYRKIINGVLSDLNKLKREVG